MSVFERVYLFDYFVGFFVVLVIWIMWNCFLICEISIVFWMKYG
jgi:hypothetical protein